MPLTVQPVVVLPEGLLQGGEGLAHRRRTSKPEGET